MPAKPTLVYHIPGRFAVGVPLEDHEAPSAEAAAELVRSGVFAASAKEASEQAFTTPEATPATDSNVKQPRPPEAPAPEPEPATSSEEPA